ncbi:MAG: sigma-70 family RNA polymerase sigma factor [Ruminococcus sp.]|nr:sigma-70 family RNA polymerase sigma factor [Ruminococcus sp.]
MTSRELAELMKRSPAESHRALVREYGRYVYAIVFNKLRSCGTNEDVEECVSDVFADIFLKCVLDTSQDGDVKRLISTIAKRTAIDRFRSLSARAGYTADTDENAMLELVSDFSVDEHIDRSELRRVLLDKIDELGEPDSTILIQKFYYNRTSKEIAETVSMTAAAVRTRCSRAMDRLRAKLVEVGVTM